MGIGESGRRAFVFGWRPKTSPRELFLDRWHIARLLPRAGLWLVGAMVVIDLLAGLLPVVFVIATSIVLGHVPAAVAGGLDSAAWHRLVTAFVVAAGAFVAQQILAPFGTALGELVDGGALRVDGTDIRSYDVEAWRRKLAVIFQDYARYEVSVADNIALGAVDHMADRAAVRDRNSSHTRLGQKQEPVAATHPLPQSPRNGSRSSVFPTCSQLGAEGCPAIGVMGLARGVPAVGATEPRQNQCVHRRDGQRHSRSEQAASKQVQRRRRRLARPVKTRDHDIVQRASDQGRREAPRSESHGCALILDEYETQGGIVREGNDDR